jgi:hypothetical protein
VSAIGRSADRERLGRWPRTVALRRLGTDFHSASPSSEVRIFDSMKDAGRRPGRCGNAAGPDRVEPLAADSRLPVTAATGHFWTAFISVCQVMPVLHQMKLALLVARYALTFS